MGEGPEDANAVIERRCSQCQCRDKKIYAAGAIDEAKPEHLVTIELRFVDGKEISSKQARAGWTYRLYRGRHAMQRYICRGCLIEAEFMDHEWANARRRHLRIEQEQKGSSNVYSEYNEDYV